MFVLSSIIYHVHVATHFKELGLSLYVQRSSTGVIIQVSRSLSILFLKSPKYIFYAIFMRNMHSEEALEEEVSTTSSETAPSLQQKLDHQRPIILCQIQKVIQVILHGIPDVVLLRGRSISFISAEVLNICHIMQIVIV